MHLIIRLLISKNYAIIERFDIFASVLQASLLRKAEGIGPTMSWQPQHHKVGRCQILLQRDTLEKISIDDITYTT